MPETDALRTELIIPRTPSPSPVPSLSGLEDIEDLSPEDLRRLARERLAEIKVRGRIPQRILDMSNSLTYPCIQNERRVKREVPGVKREFGEAFVRTPGRDRNVRPKRGQADVKPGVKREGGRDLEPVIIDLSDD